MAITWEELKSLDRNIPKREPVDTVVRHGPQSCEGKKRYTDISHVRADVRSINKKKGGRRVESYHCGVCGGIHIGGMNVDRRRFERKRSMKRRKRVEES